MRRAAHHYSRQCGLTLLEVLIALSIFSLIGVASYRVLSTVIASEKVGAVHSQELGRLQKALTIIDRDIQQLVVRDIRSLSSTESIISQHYLLVHAENYPLEFSRAGRRNPLLLARSSLQRVAYDIGTHPNTDDANSPHYGDEQQYLRRHLWSHLDRIGETSRITQVLMADVKQISVAVLTEGGRYIDWPKRDAQGNIVTKLNNKPARPLAIELSIEYGEAGQLSRIYQVL